MEEKIIAKIKQITTELVELINIIYAMPVDDSIVTVERDKLVNFVIEMAAFIIKNAPIK